MIWEIKENVSINTSLSNVRDNHETRQNEKPLKEAMMGELTRFYIEQLRYFNTSISNV